MLILTNIILKGWICDHDNVDECAKVEINQCGHKCVDTLTGYYCDCNEGYK